MGEEVNNVDIEYIDDSISIDKGSSNQSSSRSSGTSFKKYLNIIQNEMFISNMCIQLNMML